MVLICFGILNSLSCDAGPLCLFGRDMFRERSEENLASNEDAVVLVDDLIVHASAVHNTRIPLVNTINHRPARGSLQITCTRIHVNAAPANRTTLACLSSHQFDAESSTTAVRRLSFRWMSIVVVLVKQSRELMRRP